MELPINQILQGDCLEVLKGMPDKSVDLVLTDVPYGMNKDFANDTPELADKLVKDAIIECRRISKNHILSFWSAQRFDKLNDVFGDYKRVMIWDKSFAMYAPNNVGYRYEPIIWICGDKANDKRGDIFHGMPIMFKVQKENQNHPTQKPLEVMRELVLSFSKDKETILDPFCGTGTTCVAAKMERRNYIGVEISKKYCDIANERLAHVTPKLL